MIWSDINIFLNCSRRLIPLKLTRHEALRGLSTTTQLYLLSACDVSIEVAPPSSVLTLSLK